MERKEENIRPFLDVKVERAGMTGWKADEEKRELTVFLSRNKGTSEAGQPMLCFILTESVSISGVARLDVKKNLCSGAAWLDEQKDLQPEVAQLDEQKDLRSEAVQLDEQNDLQSEAALLEKRESPHSETITLNAAEDTLAEVRFIISPDGQEQVWHVRAIWCANPVLAGQYADPDIAVFGDTYYLYATTDGFSGWSGTKFHVFSSKNLVDFTDEGIILDVAGDDVAWAVGSAWAPCIKGKNGKYYFYFCAKDAAGDSHIGVACADHPAGPFTARKEPLITRRMCIERGIAMGQTIDPSVFTDEDGSSYLLFGNGNAAVVRLNEDMESLDFSTITNYEGAKDFREAITVTKRGGVYHFTWSCDDTGSPDYHVNYGTSDSIYGPITYHNTLLEKDEENGILGTGHHCILAIPGCDEYYIAYHRFYTPLKTFTQGLGFHRETCIDALHFDRETGRMLPVRPTQAGVAARKI